MIYFLTLYLLPAAVCLLLGPKLNSNLDPITWADIIAAMIVAFIPGINIACGYAAIMEWLEIFTDIIYKSKALNKSFFFKFKDKNK